jgi:hypothetical protein
MPNGSMFAYRGGASAMAAVASLDGRDPPESPDPREITPTPRATSARLAAG